MPDISAIYEVRYHKDWTVIPELFHCLGLPFYMIIFCLTHFIIYCILFRFSLLANQCILCHFLLLANPGTWSNSLRPSDTYICLSKLTITDSDNGLMPGRRQAIIRTNAGILLIGHLGINFGEILIGINKFSFRNMHLKMSSAKWRRFCLGPNVLTAAREIGTLT